MRNLIVFKQQNKWKLEAKEDYITIDALDILCINLILSHLSIVLCLFKVTGKLIVSFNLCYVGFKVFWLHINIVKLASVGTSYLKEQRVSLLHNNINDVLFV